MNNFFLWSIDHFVESTLRVRLYTEKSIGATLLSSRTRVLIARYL